MGGWTTTECSKTNATTTESFNSNFNTMQSAQESLAELRAAIRYCENAISAAEATIESMDFRQQLAKQQAMNKQESTGREEALTKQVQELNASVQFHVDREAGFLDQIKELESKVQGQYDDIVQLERENAELREDKERLTALEVQLRDKIHELKDGKATMPVIPRDVAIAIFREGIKQGVNDACNELRGQTVAIRESDYVGDFEVSFSRDVDLEEELDLDWMRDKVGSYNTESVTYNLKGLCKNLNFECRIHEIDDND